MNLKFDQDVIVSEVRETSRKPDELYLIIDRLLGAKKGNAADPVINLLRANTVGF